ncbi:MAG: transcriptional repressor LexA [Bdellovibrionales bacterium]
MTEKELKVLSYIKSYIHENSYSPSFAEIQEHFGWASKGSVQSYIKQLCEKGLIRKMPNKKRALEIVSLNAPDTSIFEESVKLPLLGSVAAGIPLERKEFDEFINVPLHLAPKPDESFVLRVSGDSMIEAGILDKDLLLIESCNYADNGTIVVASTLDEAATVKRFFHKQNQIELRPENAALQSQFYQTHEITIKGKVVGLIRSYLKF